MATVDLIMPKLGESIMEATILKWHKHPGDTVKMDETVLEIATDKVDSEVPSTAEGVLEEALYNVNDVVPVGAAIARIKTNAENKTQDTRYRAQETNDEEIETINIQQTNFSQSHAASSNGNSNRFYSPLVLNIAASEGVSMVELEKIPGSGNEGRVTKKDILQYVSERKSGVRSRESEARSRESGVTYSQKETPVYETPELRTQNSQLTTYSGNVEIIEMDRMRKLIAEHMIRSQEISAHVTSFSEADVTNMVMWRHKVKKEFEKREGTKISFTPLFIEAVVKCIKKFPMINSSVEGDKII